MTIAAVVLAAGGGSRFGGAGHKLLADFRGRPLVAWAVGSAYSAGLDETLVVWGAVALPVEGVTLVANARWMDGLSSSLLVALAEAGEHGHEAVVVGLGDQPLVPPSAWRAVAAAATPLAVATYRGRRGHPVRLARDVWPLVPAAGDQGARSLLDERPDLVQEVACDGDSADVDTVEDLGRWS